MFFYSEKRDETEPVQIAAKSRERTGQSGANLTVRVQEGGAVYCVLAAMFFSDTKELINFTELS